MQVTTGQRTFVLLLLLALFACSCWGKKSAVRFEPSTLQPGSTATPIARTLGEAQAELDALPLPEGVDAALWAQLKSSLSTALAANWDSRRISSPPTNANNAVHEMVFARAGDSSVAITFKEVHAGDCDNNGIVGVADVTPIAQLFGMGAGDGVPEETMARVDGNGDGRIGVEDITPLAQNYGTDVAGYKLEKSLSPDGPWMDAGGGMLMVRPDTTWDREKYVSQLLVPRPDYTFTDAVDLNALTYYRAVVYGTEGSGTAHGVEGDAVLIDDLAPPEWTSTVGVASVETAGVNELVVSWGEAQDARSAPVTYELYYSTVSPVNPQSSAHLSGITALTRTLVSLSGGQTYYFLVRARDAAGNEDANTVEMSGAPLGDPIEDTVPPYWVNPDEVGVIRTELDREPGNLTVYFGQADDVLSPPVRYRLVVKRMNYSQDNPDDWPVLFDQEVPPSPYTVMDVFGTEWEHNETLFCRAFALDQVGNENSEDDGRTVVNGDWNIEKIDVLPPPAYYNQYFLNHFMEDPQGRLCVEVRDRKQEADEDDDEEFLLRRTLLGEWEIAFTCDPDIMPGSAALGNEVNTARKMVILGSSTQEDMWTYWWEVAPRQWDYSIIPKIGWLGPYQGSPAGLIFAPCFQTHDGRDFLGAYVSDGQTTWFEAFLDVPEHPYGFGIHNYLSATADGRPIRFGDVSGEQYMYIRDSLAPDSSWTGAFADAYGFPYEIGEYQDSNDKMWISADGYPEGMVDFGTEEYMGVTGKWLVDLIDGTWTPAKDISAGWGGPPMDDAGYNYYLYSTTDPNRPTVHIEDQDGNENFGRPCPIRGAGGGDMLVSRTYKKVILVQRGNENWSQDTWGIYLITSPADAPYPVFH